MPSSNSRGWVLALAVATVAAGLPGQKANEASKRRTAQRNGYVLDTLTDPETGASIVRYAVRVPRELPRGGRLGLIVSLHGTNGSEAMAWRSARWALGELDIDGQYVELCLKSIGPAWKEVDDEPVRKAIAWALKTYPIDPRRVYGWGFSAGGWFWGRFGPRHQDLLAGVVLCAGGVPPLPRDEKAAETGLRLYLLAPELDRKVPLRAMRESRDRLTKAGYSFVYRELAGKKHNDAWNRESVPNVRRDAMLWCHSLRNRRAAVPQAATTAIDEAVAKLNTGRTVSARSLAAVAHVGGPQAADAIAKACRATSGAVRAAGADGALTVFFGDPVVEALVPLLVDKRSKKARQAAFDALGRAATWQREPAQKALCDLAADTRAKSSDRVRAIHQLAAAVPIELVGIRPNELILGTLIDLLMDRSGTIRKEAFAALMGKGKPGAKTSPVEPPSANGFGYNPKGRESGRTEAQERWRRWLDG